jgi:hypothetical protein
VECHHRLKGDLRPGEQWEVTKALPEALVVTRNGLEKLSPLGQSKEFNVYYRDTMPIAAGEHLLITKKINAVQMLVSLSRASREVRLYTDSKPS